MKTKNNLTKRLGIWALVVAAVLMIPLVGQWPWSGSDFIFGAVLLFGAASAYEFATRNIVSSQQRILIGGSVAIVLAAIWGVLAMN